MQWRNSTTPYNPKKEYLEIMSKRLKNIKQKTKKPMLNLYNSRVLKTRNIMIHKGYDKFWTQGCLLLGNKLLKKMKIMKYLEIKKVGLKIQMLW